MTPADWLIIANVYFAALLAVEKNRLLLLTLTVGYVIVSILLKAFQ